jgi:hypothetical protein
VLADIGPLRRSAAYRRLWVGITLSSIGGSLTYFAVILQVYRLTHSSFAVGALGLAQVVPLLTVGLLAGSLTDAVDRRVPLIPGTESHQPRSSQYSEVGYVLPQYVRKNVPEWSGPLRRGASAGGHSVTGAVRGVDTLGARA